MKVSNINQSNFSIKI